MIFICEGKNEELLVNELFENVYIFDFTGKSKEIQKRKEAGIIRGYRRLKRLFGCEHIAKIEGGIDRVIKLLEKLIEGLDFIPENILVICDSEHGKLEKKLDNIVEKFDVNMSTKNFNVFSIYNIENKIFLLVFRPNLEIAVKNITGKDIREVREKEKLIKEFVSKIDLKRILGNVL